MPDLLDRIAAERTEGDMLDRIDAEMLSTQPLDPREEEKQINRVLDMSEKTGESPVKLMRRQTMINNLFRNENYQEAVEQRQEEKREEGIAGYWSEFLDATSRGTARVGAALSRGMAFLHTNRLPGMFTPRQEPSPEQKKYEEKRAKEYQVKAELLWEIAKHPELAAQKEGKINKAINLVGETVPYITATTAAYTVAGPLGGFAIGGMVEGNSAYQEAIDSGVSKKKAKAIGVGVGVVSGAIEAFGGKYAEQLLLKTTAKLKSRLAKAGAVFTIGSAVEALEEGAQEIAAITGEETYRDVDWNEATTRILGSMAGGAFLGGAMRGASMATKRLTQFPDKPLAERGMKPVTPTKEHAKLEKELTQAIVEKTGLPEEEAKIVAQDAIDDKFYVPEKGELAEMQRPVPPIKEAIPAPPKPAEAIKEAEPIITPKEPEIKPEAPPKVEKKTLIMSSATDADLFVPSDIKLPERLVSKREVGATYSKVGEYLKNFARKVPEFTLEPEFTVNKDKKLVFQDGGRFTFEPQAFGIKPEQIELGQKIQIDLDSYGIKRASKAAIKKAWESGLIIGDRPIIEHYIKTGEILKPVAEAPPAREEKITPVIEPKKPKKEGGFVEIEEAIKVAKMPGRWFLNIFEPQKLTATKHGKDVVATVMRGIHKPEAQRLEFEAKEIESLDKTYKQMEEWLGNYSRDVQEQVMLTRGHGLEGEARKLQVKAFAGLPKELSDSKVRRALDEIADFNYEYLTEVSDKDVDKMQDYFYGIYKSPRKITAFLNFWKTTKRFMEHKVFPTYADAKAYGLEIRDPNPVANLRAEYRAISHLAAMKWLKEELMRIGDGKYIMNESEAPLSWDVIGDKRRSEPVFADVRVEPELAKLINDLISTNKISQQPVLNFFRRTNNFLRTIRFIGSAFHMVQIAKQSVADSGYLGFYKTTAGHGLKKGFEKSDPIFNTPEYKWYLENGGGHRYSIESEAQKVFNDVISKLTKSERAIVKGVSAPLKLPVGFVNWMFTSYIPKIKYAKFLDTVAEQETKLNRSLTPAETQEIIKEQQNFYGMMNERLFGRSGTTTSALRFIFMAPGYAEGNYRTMIKAASQWGITPEGFRAGRSRSNIVNSWIITGTLATIGTLIFTGKPPKKPESIEEMRDLLKIDTGKKDEYGKRIMIDLATYDKDYWNVFFNTLRGRPDIAVKLSIDRIGGMKAPTLTLAHDIGSMVLGKSIYDWKDDKVYHLTDPLLEKITKLTVYEIQQMIPISASVYLTSRRRAVDRTISAIEALAGVRPGRTEKDIKEFEIVKEMWDMRDKREKLSYKLNKYDDPWRAVEKYNKTLDDLIDNKFITDELKKRIEKLKIDPKKVITWKRFPIEKLTKEQIRISIREHTLKTGVPHKGFEDRVKQLREELKKRK